jgi:hypothetical protein
MPRALSGGFDAVLREMAEGDRRGQGFAFSGNRPPAGHRTGLRIEDSHGSDRFRVFCTRAATARS